MKTTERQIHFYELAVHSHTKAKGISSPACAPLASLLEAINKAGPKGYQVRGSDDTKVRVEITDWRWEKTKKQACVLMNLADREASDVAFRHFKNKLVRKGNKTKEEGVESSAHVLIRCYENEPRGIVLLTMQAGVTTYEIVRFLNNFAAALRSQPAHRALFNFQHPSGAVDAKGVEQTYGVKYSFTCTPFKGKLLDQVLENGSFLGLDLIAHEYSQFDEGGNLQIEQQCLSIRAHDPILVSGPKIRNACAKFMSKKPPYTFDKMRIRFSEAGKERSETLSVNDLEKAFTMKKLLLLDPPVDSQQSALSNEILQGMESLL